MLQDELYRIFLYPQRTDTGTLFGPFKKQWVQKDCMDILFRRIYIHQLQLEWSCWLGTLNYAKLLQILRFKVITYSVHTPPVERPTHNGGSRAGAKQTV